MNGDQEWSPSPFASIKTKRYPGRRAFLRAIWSKRHILISSSYPYCSIGIRLDHQIDPQRSPHPSSNTATLPTLKVSKKKWGRTPPQELL